MSPQEIRIECLRLAVGGGSSLRSEQPTIDQIIADAQRLERFINGDLGGIIPRESPWPEHFSATQNVTKIER